ncbi:MAG TPA: hypothetical protein VFS53_00135 [Gemmatimonadota bacterium]|nr:hypothetical protein [Gemmatimonadota bacterium]
MSARRVAGRAAFALLIAGAAFPASSLGQTLQATLDARREAMPRGKHAWQETWLVPEAGTSAPDAVQVTKFGGRVWAYQDGDKERLELRAARGDELEEPVVVVSDGDGYWLVTKVGATPLAESAKASDRWLALVLAGPPGDAPGYRTVDADGGGVAAVVVRAPEPSDFDEDKAFALRLPQGGSGLVREGLAQFSPGRDPNVTAAAGTRGVDQVETANGAVSVTPDPAAVEWMEGQRVTPGELERFRLEGRLAPYDALPQEAGA